MDHIRPNGGVQRKGTTILIAVVRKHLARDIHVVAYEATANRDVKDHFAAPGHVNNETDECARVSVHINTIRG
jgi:hypothetical protein